MIAARLVNRIRDDILPLDVVKQHLVVEHDLDDTLISLYRDAAIEHVENVTRRTLPLSQFDMSVPQFEPVISLRSPPVRAVSNITYDNGTERVSIPSTDYTVNTDYEWVWIKPKTVWPTGCDLQMHVIAGYGTIATALTGYAYTFPFVFGGLEDAFPIPSPLKLACLLLIAHWYANREETMTGASIGKIPAGVDAILFSYRNYKH